MMITVEEATKIILEQALSLGEEEVTLAQAPGRVLRETLSADRDFPPFNRVAMDGIAICQASFAAGQRQFAIAGMAQAGAAPLVLSNPATCLEVMTGAVVPQGADAVVRYEDLLISQGLASIVLEEVKPGQNIHPQGADRKAGEVILQPGKILTGAEMGLAATIGKSKLRVAKQPSVIVVVNGDELTAVDGPAPLPYQIRQSNNYALRGLLQQWGIEADTDHLPDDETIIRQKLVEYLHQYDAIILCGGVSKGKLDFLPSSLQAVGVRQLFHRISQRPGQPFWFGRADTRPNLVFAFPGNPVSAFMCMTRYFQPWLRACQGLDPITNQGAVLAQDYHFKPDLTYFLQVQISKQFDGQRLASPITGGGSGDLANLTETDGFLELPKGRDFFQAGEIFPYWPFRTHY